MQDFVITTTRNISLPKLEVSNHQDISIQGESKGIRRGKISRLITMILKKNKKKMTG